MNKPVFFLVPVVALWAFIALAPVPHLAPPNQGGLAQVADAGPAMCLSRCQEEVRRLGQDCLNSGRNSDECGALARSHYEICQRACTSAVITPVAPPPTTDQPATPQPTTVPTLTCADCSTKAEEAYTTCKQAGQSETDCVNRGNRIYSDCQKIACLGSTGKRIPTMPGCKAECINLGQTYQSQCAGAGRSSAFCEKLRASFVNNCNVYMCGQERDTTVTQAAPVAPCFSSCGGPNREYMDKLCIDSGETTTKCDYGNDYLMVQCMKGSCSASSLGGIPDEPKTAAPTPSTGGTSSPSASPAQSTDPCLSCHRAADEQLRACHTNGSSPESCATVHRRTLEQCTRVCGQAVVTPQPVQGSPTSLQPTGGEAPQANSPSSDAQVVPPSELPTPTQLPSDQPSAIVTIWNTVTNFFAGLLGRDSRSTLPDGVCLNAPTNIQILSGMISSGVVRGDYYHGSTCYTAVIKANSLCQQNAQIALDVKVRATCASLCKRTATNTCAPSPLITNFTVKGCDLAQDTPVAQSTVKGSGDAAWVPGGQASSGGSNGFCHARSNAKLVSADLDCRCGGVSGISGPVPLSGNDVPGFTQDARTGQEIPTYTTYYIVEVWTAENCSECRSYSNVEVGPDGRAYYLEANRPITGASPVEAELVRAYNAKEINSKDFRVTHYHGDSKGLYPDPKGDGAKMSKIWGKIPRVKITKFVNGSEDTTTGIFYPQDRGGISSISKALSELQ